MKQYITQEQYNALSDDERRRFINWTNSKGSHAVTIRSIGHLIWFLHEHEWDCLHFIKYDEVAYGRTLPIDKQHQWHVSNGDYEYATVSYHETELVDALWQAVQAALKSSEDKQ